MNGLFERLLAKAKRLPHVDDLMAVTASLHSAVHDALLPTLRGRPGEVPGMPESWSSSLDGEGEFLSGRHTEAGRACDYKLYLPSGDPARRRPLVVMLHGCTQTAEDFAIGTGMNTAAQRRGCLILYPEQSAQANAARCWTWFKDSHQQRGRGEPALLAGLTRAVMLDRAVDPRRVYVAGLSAGGAMAAILGQAYPELFAAVGVHSGLPVGAARDATSAFAAMQAGPTADSAAVGTMPPTIIFHGDQDHTVHPTNGEQVLRASTRAVTSPPDIEHVPGGAGTRPYTRQGFRDSQGVRRAEHWTVHGAGHAWSGGQKGGSYADALGPSATEAMLDFFFTHTQQGPAVA